MIQFHRQLLFLKSLWICTLEYYVYAERNSSSGGLPGGSVVALDIDDFISNCKCEHLQIWSLGAGK